MNKGAHAVETAKHRAAFEAWYLRDRNFRDTARDTPYKLATLYRWSETYEWHGRADRRDAEVARRQEQEQIERRGKLLKEQAAAGQLMRKLGVRYLADRIESGAFENAKEALLAIEKGFVLERQAEGLPDWVGQILNASDEDLLRERERLLREMASSAAVVPVEPVEIAAGDVLAIAPPSDQGDEASDDADAEPDAQKEIEFS